jgi:large subunit ribosomal protein L29
VKAKELRERTTEALTELSKSLQNDLFQARFKNYTNRLNDTASIRRTRRDLARVKTLLTQRAQTAAEGPATGAASGSDAQ